MWTKLLYMPWVGRLCIYYIVLVKVLQGRPRISTFIISDNSLRTCTEYVWPRTYTHTIRHIVQPGLQPCAVDAYFMSQNYRTLSPLFTTGRSALYNSRLVLKLTSGEKKVNLNF